MNDINVNDVRRGLTELRNAWKNHTPDNPICLSRPMMEIFDDDDKSQVLTYESFSFQFVRSQHARRYLKAKKALGQQVRDEENIVILSLDDYVKHPSQIVQGLRSCSPTE